jgi:hypothetical protein
MTEPEQWRFQWPDGTWIRWNPQTQAWEKEAAGAEVPAASEIAAPAPVEPPVEVVEVEDPPVSEQPAVEEPDVEELVVEEPAVEEPVARALPVDLEKALADVPRVEEPMETLPSRRERRTGRTSRSMARDVLPPRPEPERPGASLWPTVVTGMVVGLGVGLLIWNVIR